jgi:hypothetical protein
MWSIEEMKMAMKNEILGEKPVTVAFYPADISLGLNLDGIWVSAFGGRRLTARAMAWFFKV